MKRTLCILLTALLLLTVGMSAVEGQRTYSATELQQMWEWLSPLMQQAGVFPFALIRLQRGDEGMEVVMLQARLKQLGYYGKAIDPHFGSGTLAAMKLFEQVHALVSDGVADVTDQILLYSTRALYNPYAPVKGRPTPRPGDKTSPGGSSGERFDPREERVVGAGVEDAISDAWKNPGIVPNIPDNIEPSPEEDRVRIPRDQILLPTTSIPIREGLIPRQP